MRTSWLASMQSALASTLARPEWWAIALAAFLVRGGFLLILLPIISLPSAAQLANAVAPTLSGLILGDPSLGGALVATASAMVILGLLAAAGLAGAWFDLALVREAAEDEELELGWRPIRASIRRGFGIRLAAHLPTLVAVGYGIVRLIVATYSELLSPGDAAVPLATRILESVPDAVIAVALTWLAGETVGGLAARRAAAGQGVGAALAASIRQLFSGRGVATLALSLIVLAAVGAPFALAVSRAWEHVSAYLLDGSAPPIQLWAAVVLLVASWVLGLALLGAALAWRATAWTAEVPGQNAGDSAGVVTPPGLQASEA